MVQFSTLEEKRNINHASYNDTVSHPAKET
jgi:hypothetical protein